MPMTTRREPVALFLSYAHEDEALLRQLEVHLSLLKRRGLISTWHDRQIIAGTDWSKTIDEHLERAAIILLLVSPDFLASDYCYGVEMQRALERHSQKKAHAIPIFLRPVDWQAAPFAHLQGLPRDGKFVTEWDNRDVAFLEVVQGLRRLVESTPPIPVSTSPTTLLPLWNIPYPRNPVFTGREQFLSLLADTLRTDEAATLSQPQVLAISGLGGIGKTQVAIEYAYQHQQDYQAILWIHADTAEALIAGYMEIAHLLNLPERNEQDQSLVVKAVQAWLKTQMQWLLILDNADDLALVHAFLPSTFGGHILLTTRAQAMGRLAKRMEVKTMDPDVGALLLLRRAGLVPHNASLETALPSDTALAREVAQELGGLPLALDQAGAYLEETSCSLLEY